MNQIHLCVLVGVRKQFLTTRNDFMFVKLKVSLESEVAVLFMILLNHRSDLAKHLFDFFAAQIQAKVINSALLVHQDLIIYG